MRRRRTKRACTRVTRGSRPFPLAPRQPFPPARAATKHRCCGRWCDTCGRDTTGSRQREEEGGEEGRRGSEVSSAFHSEAVSCAPWAPARFLLLRFSLQLEGLLMAPTYPVGTGAASVSRLSRALIATNNTRERVHCHQRVAPTCCPNVVLAPEHFVPFSLSASAGLRMKQEACTACDGLLQRHETRRTATDRWSKQREGHLWA